MVKLTTTTKALSPSKHEGENSFCKLKWPSPETVFGSSTLAYSTEMLVQNDKLQRTGSAPSAHKTTCLIVTKTLLAFSLFNQWLTRTEICCSGHKAGYTLFSSPLSNNNYSMTVALMGSVCTHFEELVHKYKHLFMLWYYFYLFIFVSPSLTAMHLIKANAFQHVTTFFF